MPEDHSMHEVVEAGEGAEEFLENTEIAEEIPEDEEGMVPEDEDGEIDGEFDGEEGEEHTLEIDMSNNSWTYFDQHQDSVFTVTAHPKLPLVVSGAADHSAKLWTVHKQPPTLVADIKDHKESVIAAKFSCGGEFLITGDMAGQIQVHKANKTGEKWEKFGVLEEVEEVLWIETHSTLPYFAFGATDGSVWVYHLDKSTKSLINIMSGYSHTLDCTGGCFMDSKDENDLNLVTISEEGSVVSWNCFTSEIIYKLQPHVDFKGVESPWVTIKNNKNMLAIGGRNGQLSIINNDNGKVVHSLKTLDSEDQAELSIEALSWCKAPNLNILAVGLVHGDVFLFDTQQWRLRNSIKVSPHPDYENAITKLQFVDNTPILIGSSSNGKIYKWDVRTCQELFVGVGHNMPIFDFAIFDNGKKLVTAGDEGVSLVFQN